MRRFLLFAAAMLLPLMTFAASSLVTPPTWITLEDYTMRATFGVLNATTKQYDDTQRNLNIKVGFDGNDIFISGLSYTYPNAFIKGTIEGNMATFATGQLVGQDLFQSVYLVGFALKDSNIVNMDFILFFNPDDKSLRYDRGSGVMIAETTKADSEETDMLSYLNQAAFAPGTLPTAVPVIVPENLVAEDYLFDATYMRIEQDQNNQEQLVSESRQMPVKVGFDVDTLYIRGIADNVPNGWTKAVKNSAGKYIVPAGQYMGYYDALGWGQYIYHYYITATNSSNKLLDVEFTVSDDKATITNAQTIAMNGSSDVLKAYSYYRDISIKKMVEKEATPQNPTLGFRREGSASGALSYYIANIFVPLVDVNKDPMLSSKLFYQFFCEKNGQQQAITFPKDKFRLKADMTELPYGYNETSDFSGWDIYFEKFGEEELKTWTKLGMQSIYRGLDIEHKSEITWFDLTKFWATGISHIDAAPVADSYYDLQGRCVPANAKGLLLRRTILSDGTIVSKKVLRK